MRTSDSTLKYDKAWLEVQPKIGAADKDGTSNRNKYATLTKVIHLVRPILNTGGFIFEQSLDIHESRDVVITRITHVGSGEWKECISFCTSDANTHPQKHGIAITYLKRYQLKTLCGMPETDDDAESYHTVGKPNTPPVDKANPRTVRSDYGKAKNVDGAISNLKKLTLDELIDADAGLDDNTTLSGNEKDTISKAITERKGELLAGKLNAKEV